MLRVPSSILPGQFQSLSIQRPLSDGSGASRSDDSRSDASAMTFVAYRSDVYPERNEVFFEEHAVIVVLEGEKKFSSPTQELHVRKGDILFFQRGCYSMNESIDSSYRSLVFFVNEKLLKEFVGQHLDLFSNSVTVLLTDLILSFSSSPGFATFIDSLFPYFGAKTPFLNDLLGLSSRNYCSICLNWTVQTVTRQLVAYLPGPENGARLHNEYVPA